MKIVNLKTLTGINLNKHVKDCDQNQWVYCLHALPFNVEHQVSYK
jgi:hypothetical protein